MGRREELLARLKQIDDAEGGAVPSSMNIGGVTYKDPKYEARKQTLAQQQKESQKSTRNRAKVEDLVLQSLLLWGKNADWTKQKTGIGPGRLGGAVGWTAGKAGINPNYEPFVGDQVETSTGIAKIAAPSAKVGPELIRTFGRTLPKGYSTFDESKGQVVSTIANAIYEDASSAGTQISVNEARNQADRIVGDFITKNPETFRNIAPSGNRYFTRGT